MRCLNCCHMIFENLKYCKVCKKENEINNILKINIKGLFNKFDYEFDFENEENISIVVAPNGAGKTTILNLIKFLITPTYDNYVEIKNIPFKFARCEMSDGNIISFERLTEKEIEKNKLLSFEDFFDELQKDRMSFFSVPKDDYEYSIFESLMNNTGDFDKLELFCYKYQIRKNGKLKTLNFLKELKDYFINNSISKDCDKGEVLQKVQNVLFEKFQKICPYASMVNFNSKIRTVVPYDIKYIDLISTRRVSEDFSDDNRLKAIISAATMRLKIKNRNPLFEKEIISKLSKHVANMNFLVKAQQKIGRIINNQELGFFTSEETINKMISLFEKMFNERNRITNKKIVFSKHKGFEIFQDGKALPLRCLSAGEVNDFALLYRVIFNPYRANIILIDEPEISLHVDWQESMLDNFMEISKLSGTQIIVATHSPHIISTHYDLIAKRKVKLNETR